MGSHLVTLYVRLLSVGRTLLLTYKFDLSQYRAYENFHSKLFDKIVKTKKKPRTEKIY